jgi:predicted RNA-binding Zn-ribbon protein involved in translation (DUF1610 family)
MIAERKINVADQKHENNAMTCGEKLIKRGNIIRKQENNQQCVKSRQ